MKKLKLIVSVVFVLAMLAALAVGVSAKWWEDNPYEDVKSDAWYYDAVRICRENGIFNGTSETAFGTGVKLTRAQFVTALAGAAGYDKAEYAGKAPFDDVPAGKWYSAPVAWASEKGITSGVGGGKFAPNKAITREELALMLYKYHLASGGKEFTADISLSSFPDAGKVSKWAKNALAWAYYHKIVTGVAAGDQVLLSPKTTAAREQAAQMMVRLLGTKPTYEINGNDLSLYKIVYPAAGIIGDDPKEEFENSPYMLQRFIKDSLGVELPVVTDETEASDYEILLGHTNREEAGLVTVDRGALESPQHFKIEVQGNRLVFIAVDENRRMEGADRRTKNVHGTQNSIFFFAEEVLGAEFFNDKNIVFTADPVISLPDGWSYADAPVYDTRILYMYSEGSESSNGCDFYYTEAYCGVPHMLGNIIIGDFGGYAHVDWGTPCLSDPENIAKLKANVRVLLEEKPTLNLIGLIQNDSNSYCQCEKCKAAYREDGSTCAMVIRACNAVCEDLENDYPDVKILTWAYTWSAKPPAVTKLHKNLIICYNTLVLCPAHAYTDTTCKFNKTSREYLTKWGELSSELYLWDHTGAFTAALTPFPDWDSILENAQYLADNGCRGVFLNGMSSAKSDFADMRHYLCSLIYRKTYMSREEFYYHMDRYLKHYYGAGWKNLREYIDTITELGNHKDHSFHAPVSGFYDFAEVRDAADRLDALWTAAENAANGDELLLRRIAIAKGSWMYLRQSATWETMMKNGTEEQKELYRVRNQELYDNIIEFDQKYQESDGEPHFDAELSPVHW